jgi:RNA polymerase sigma-70 factor (ECF subfamily)
MATIADNPITPEIEHHIRIKVKEVIGRYGYTRSDREDLEQDLRLHLLENVHRYTPDRGTWETFAKTMVHRWLAHLIDDRCAAKRHWSKAVPMVNGTEEAVLASSGYDDSEQRDRRMDVAEAIAELPPELKEIAEALMSKRPASLFREAVCSEWEVRMRMRRLREIFAAKGLDPKGN